MSPGRSGFPCHPADGGFCWVSCCLLLQKGRRSQWMFVNSQRARNTDRLADIRADWGCCLTLPARLVDGVTTDAKDKLPLAQVDLGPTVIGGEQTSSLCPFVSSPEPHPRALLPYASYDVVQNGNITRKASQPRHPPLRTEIPLGINKQTNARCCFQPGSHRPRSIWPYSPTG